MAEYVPWNKACSFTCPLTCEGPGDPDHESQADRTARLAGTLRRNKASNNDTPPVPDATPESVYFGRTVTPDV